MKIIEKIVIVNKEIFGDLTVESTHIGDCSTIEDRKYFLDDKSAKDYANDDSYCDSVLMTDIRRDLMICVGEVEISSTTKHISIDDIDEMELYSIGLIYPNYEVKEMKYEIDGVKSTKKVLVEKELEVA